MKELLDHICKTIPNARELMLSALQNEAQYGLWNTTNNRFCRRKPGGLSFFGAEAANLCEFHLSFIDRIPVRL